MYQSSNTAVSEDFLTEEPTFTLARKSKRWLAALIDYVIVTIITFTLVYCFGEGTTDENGFKTYSLTGLPFVLSSFVPWFLFLPLLEMLNNGQTVGKMIFKIRSADMNGSKIGMPPVFVRHLLDIVDYLPFFGIVGLLVASNNSHKQRVGDLVAKTIVIEA